MPALVESAGHVEAAFPFAAFEGEENFAASVEVAEPLGVFLITGVVPGTGGHL